MKKTQRFFALILSVMMLLPILGCGQAKPQESKPESTITESSVPESKPESSVPESKPESSVPEISTPESNESEEPSTEEDSKHDPEEIVMVEPGMDENIPSIDELIANDYSLLSYPSDETIMSTWEDSLEYGLDVCKDGVYRAYKHCDHLGRYILDSIDILYEGPVTYFTSSTTAMHIASEDKIILVLYDGTVRTLYTSPDGEEIRHMVVGKNFIYFVEGSFLNIMTYDGSEIREICELGDVTHLILLDSNTILYRADYYNGELLKLTSSWGSGFPVDGVYSEKEDIPNEEKISDCYYYEISTGEKTPLTLEEYRHTYFSEEAIDEGLPKA